MSKWDSKPNISNKNGIVWSEQYGVSKFYTKTYHLTCEWTSDGYNVVFDANFRAKDKPKTFDNAEKLAVNVLRRYVKDLQNIIDTYDEHVKENNSES